MERQTKGNLYLIPTPLSENPARFDVGEDYHQVLKKVRFFLAENLRTARRFISSLNLGIVLEELQMEVLNKDTHPDDLNRMCEPLLRGHDIGVMSEAGCPGIADPGNLAVKYAHRHQIKVIPLTGPSSIFLALMASGLNGQSFAFHGYLPIDKHERIQAIRRLEKASMTSGATQIFIETPYRNQKLFDDLLRTCQPGTMICVARDITGPAELIRTASISAWKGNGLDLHKIPTVFLLHVP